ncbi:unnamed protein product [Musa acuminata subsp. malaccensis]|uniref:(wild Malaysian banana) hypothetical protein n=1 Tax=Musa acuminata subsp. malaccensis TaxID=214687 RepID=A0A804JLS7_MUSAM|nr:PREDICTED: transcription factor FER-LIKE IRON DEFICIENCY-INDUCED TRANSCRIPTION FACTOR [Musa acuminata subsp. malaccensis]CAG1847758.1 unnamed protein product [Musa acuminata subsp. malaccensis]
MESDHPFLFAPQARISNEDDGFDPVFESYDHELLQFMLFDGGFAGDGHLSLLREGALFDAGGHEGTTATQYLQADAPSGSPDLSLEVDDDPPACGGCHDGGDSPGGITKTRRDRSKTLISERKRRVRMKEKLYELRSLVPNITKMDKASIIADAVVYMKNLQSQAKKLEEEVSMLESSSREGQPLQVPSRKTTKATDLEEAAAVRGGNIMQVNAFEVGEGRFYVKVEGSMGDGAASSLYAAVESLLCFDLESSNFSLNPNGFVFTLTFKIGDFSREMNASSMELWVMGALLREGFQLMQTTPPL